MCDPNTCRAGLTAVDAYWTSICGGTPTHLADVKRCDKGGCSCSSHEVNLTGPTAE